jgi:hypothetical protein
MKSDDPMLMLERAAGHIRAMNQLDPSAQPSFELLSGALIWSDERKLDSFDAVCALRPVWNYRTGLLLGEPPARFEAAWSRAKELFPEWIGFDPSRCTPTPELTALARKLQSKGDREIDKCDRLMRREEWRKAHAGRKP